MVLVGLLSEENSRERGLGRLCAEVFSLDPREVRSKGIGCLTLSRWVLASFGRAFGMRAEEYGLLPLQDGFSLGREMVSWKVTTGHLWKGFRL